LQGFAASTSYVTVLQAVPLYALPAERFLNFNAAYSL
jgi:hypothetical protein